MPDNNAEATVPARSYQEHKQGSRLGRWALGLTFLVACVLVIQLVMFGALQGWFESPDLGEAAWLQDSALAKVLATYTPSPTPTPTSMPSEVAAQFIPQLQGALEHKNWERSLELMAIMQAVDPRGKEVSEWSVTTHLQYGQALVEAGQEDEAQVQFDEAVALVPENETSMLWQDTTQRYRAGREAFKAGDWDAAIKSFTQVYKRIPDYSDAFSRLVSSYHRKGETAIEQKEWLVAIDALQEAIERTPDDDPTLAELNGLLSVAYQGQAEVVMGKENWNNAIEILNEARAQIPKDEDLVDLQARAYRQRGITYLDAVKLKPAKADLEMALSLRSNDEKAQQHLDRVNYLLSKKIEIDISKQRLYAYKDGKLVFNWPVSTGLRGRDTATGRYQVLDKIPMAYSRVWRLKMPYWLGIYWVQGIENGIHALPIRPNGSVMWGGLLGQRASYGCVILSKANAKKLYNWADIGTQVHIHR
jgi:tetratricopeptide (TPR) repeat protein